MTTILVLGWLACSLAAYFAGCKTLSMGFDNSVGEQAQDKLFAACVSIAGPGSLIAVIIAYLIVRKEVNERTNF